MRGRAGWMALSLSLLLLLVPGHTRSMKGGMGAMKATKGGMVAMDALKGTMDAVEQVLKDMETVKNRKVDNIVYSDSSPAPCDVEHGVSLLCWTCHHADSQQQCQDLGFWHDCTDTLARCGVDFTYAGDGAVASMERGCRNFTDCTRHQFSVLTDVCTGSKETCSYCTYGERDVDFKCLNVSRLEDAEARVYSTVHPCGGSSDLEEDSSSRLSCWACRNEKGDQDCMEHGHWELCHHQDSVCEYKSHTNQAGEVGQVFRQCARRDDCRAYEASPRDPSPCSKERNGTVCNYCGYGVNRLEFNCVQPVCEGGAEDEGLLCWTCRNASSHESCYAEGHWQSCRRGNPRCELQYVLDPAVAVASVSRGCKELDECTYYDEKPGEVCVDDEEEGFTTCRNCTLGDEGVDHKCANLTEIAPCAIDEGQSLMCWTCFEQDGDEGCKKNGYWQACGQDQPWCEAEYLLDEAGLQSKISRGCVDRPACRSLGQDKPYCMAWGKRSYCRHCEFAAYRWDHFCLDASMLQAYSPRAYSFDWPCGLNATEDQYEENMACLTCEGEPDDSTCLEHGHWEVCCHENPRCEYEVKLDAEGRVQNVSRRCQAFDNCTNHELDHSDVCDKHAADDTCTYCSFGVNNVEFQCTDNSTACGGRIIGGKPGTGYVKDPHLRTVTTLACPDYGDDVDCSVEAGVPSTCFEDDECGSGEGSEANCCVNRCHMECVPLYELITVTECTPFGGEGLHFSEGDEYEAHGFKCTCGKSGPYHCQPCDGGIPANDYKGPGFIDENTAHVHGPLPSFDRVDLGLVQIGEAMEDAFENNQDIFKYRDVVADKLRAQQQGESDGERVEAAAKEEFVFPGGWEKLPAWKKAIWEQENGEDWQGDFMNAGAAGAGRADNPFSGNDKPIAPAMAELSDLFGLLTNDTDTLHADAGPEDGKPILMIEDAEEEIEGDALAMS